MHFIHPDMLNPHNRLRAGAPAPDTAVLDASFLLHPLSQNHSLPAVPHLGCELAWGLSWLTSLKMENQEPRDSFQNIKQSITSAEFISEGKWVKVEKTTHKDLTGKTRTWEMMHISKNGQSTDSVAVTQRCRESFLLSRAFWWSSSNQRCEATA